MDEELNNNIETSENIVSQISSAISQSETSDAIYTIENVVKIIESATDVKMKKVNNLDAEYISLGQITEEQLLDIGFVFSDFSSYIKCPIYKLGKNIEAIFNETILHIYDLRG